jgi:hypothetical protein
VCFCVHVICGVATQVQEEIVFLERRKACSIMCVDAAIVLVGLSVCVHVSTDAVILWTSLECVLHASSVLTLLSVNGRDKGSSRGKRRR